MWIVAHTGWTVRVAPGIRFVRRKQLVEMYAGGNENAKTMDIGALYSPEHQMIYLSTEWNPDDLHDRAILLHELIHHLQKVNKIKSECPSRREFEVYSLEISWLREKGIKEPYKVLRINDVFMLTLSQCPVY